MFTRFGPAIVLLLLAIGGVVFALFGPTSSNGNRDTNSGETTPSGSSDTSQSDPEIPIAEPLQPLIVEEPAETPAGMVWIPGSTFLMGDDDSLNPKGEPLFDERPAHEVELDGFWMDRTEVTNAQFKKFAKATGYMTVAERKLKREDFIGQVEDIATIPEDKLKPCSICFNPNFDRKALRQDFALWPYQVWNLQEGANWRHPDGPDSSIDDRMNHPVVHVAWHDAVAYCKWANKSLPTEAQWEYASRGGEVGNTYPWGNELAPGGKWLANIWQGEFPFENKLEDGFKTTSPVASFSPNGYGLYDMAGNLWEWCADFYRPDYYSNSPRRNPQGPNSSFDPLEPHLPKRVQRGGSFMCNANYCIGYRNSARMKGEMTSGSFHNGFRCVVNATRASHE